MLEDGIQALALGVADRALVLALPVARRLGGLRGHDHELHGPPGAVARRHRRAPCGEQGPGQGVVRRDRPQCAHIDRRSRRDIAYVCGVSSDGGPTQDVEQVFAHVDGPPNERSVRRLALLGRSCRGGSAQGVFEWRSTSRLSSRPKSNSGRSCYVGIPEGLGLGQRDQVTPESCTLRRFQKGVYQLLESCPGGRDRAPIRPNICRFGPLVSDNLEQNWPIRANLGATSGECLTRLLGFEPRFGAIQTNSAKVGRVLAKLHQTWPIFRSSPTKGRRLQDENGAP